MHIFKNLSPFSILADASIGVMSGKTAKISTSSLSEVITPPSGYQFCMQVHLETRGVSPYQQPLRIQQQEARQVLLHLDFISFHIKRKSMFKNIPLKTDFVALMNDTLVIIPIRLKASRFPNKPFAKLVSYQCCITSIILQ